MIVWGLCGGIWFIVSCSVGAIVIDQSCLGKLSFANVLCAFLSCKHWDYL